MHFSVEATHTGEIEGFAPTGKRLTFKGMALCRLEKGMIAEDDVNDNDVLEVLRGASEDAGAGVS